MLREKALAALKNPAPNSVLKKTAQEVSQPTTEGKVAEDEGIEEEPKTEAVYTTPSRKRLRKKGPINQRQGLQE